MAEEVRAVIVDTYAIIADLTGQAPPRAIQILEKVRIGEVKGILHYLIIYELAYHWRRGRLPFRDEKELQEFINTYFKIEPSSLSTAVEASRIKIIGDQILRDSNDPKLKRRRLSVSDATTIVLAERYKAPIVTGDIDLSYVAQKLGLKVIW